MIAARPSGALARPCPRCNAGIGERCWARSAAYPKRRQTPHDERKEPRVSRVVVKREPRPRQRPEIPAYARRGPHGTRGRYQSGCRCDECREFFNTRQRDYRARIRGTLAPDDPRHGSTTGYGNYGCRCERCTQAAVDFNRDLKERTRAAVMS